MTTINVTAHYHGKAAENPLMEPLYHHQEVTVPDFPRADVTYTRALWRELHTKEDPTEAWLRGWLERVPNITCDCRAWVLKWVAANPPDWDDFRPWSVDLHNAVNEKLERQVLPYVYAFPSGWGRRVCING